MIGVTIKNIKSLMNKLLIADTFDAFLLGEATIQTYNTFHIDGHINKAFYTAEELEDKTICPYDYSLWKNSKSFCFDIIKGKHTPISFRFILHLSPDLWHEVLDDMDVTVPMEEIKAFVLTLDYSASTLSIRTGTSLRTFLPDKSADAAWDKYVHRFLQKNEIEYDN